MHAANQAILVRLTRQARQVFANLDAGNVGRGRPKLAAEVRRRVGLQIERLELARPAEQIDQDARFRPPSPRRITASRRRAKHVGQ